MRPTLAARSLVSGILVYVVAAACGASEHAVGFARDGGDIGVIADALVDNLTNPVGEASADPLPPDVAEEKCDKTYPYSGITSHYAEHAYPGHSMAELAKVVALADAPAGYVPGYPKYILPVQVKDGGVAVMCATSVTFVLPR